VQELPVSEAATLLSLDILDDDAPVDEGG
jgi:hypothetical protein